MSVGVSVVVCCHNSARRLPATLAHLAAQRREGTVPWEVIVVDNGSTDDTARVARDSWPEDSRHLLRVVAEPRLGLNHARLKGLREAAYEFVSFVDDDNWVCPQWAERVAEILTQHPDVGACGGPAEAVCEVDPPRWFEQYQRCYCIGPQAAHAGDATAEPGVLWGAGLSVRKAAWQGLAHRGFHFRLSDRQGTALTGGGDLELCLALRLHGWRLWYDPQLRLQHFLPANRLQWGYLRRLVRCSAASMEALTPYYSALSQHHRTPLERLRETWQWQSLSALQLLVLRHPIKLLLSLCFPLEGDRHVFHQELARGRLVGLLRGCKQNGIPVPETAATPRQGPS
jgi:cellulose synthase/poly-beta-1,6-N-acetylglucosamine synthase-like glycosyltransferase